MNWGKVTVLILLVFVVFIGWMSFVMFKAPNDDYDHQYYEDGLNFNHDYDREARVAKEHAQPTIRAATENINITFPQIIKGKVTFMRPSSDAPDATYQLDNANGKPIDLSTTKLVKGKWQLVFDWTSNNETFLYHQEVYVK